MPISLGGSSSSKYAYTPFDFTKTLSTIPDYEQLSEAEIQAQANLAAELVAAPQLAAAEKTRQWNELQHYNDMQKLNSSQAGVDEQMKWAEAQGKKADAYAAATSGANARSGLTAHLANQRAMATEGDRLALAAQMAAQKQNLMETYNLSDRQVSDLLENISYQQGLTAGNYYNEMYNNQLTNLNNYNMSKNDTAVGLGNIWMQGEDIKQRQAQALMNNKMAKETLRQQYKLGMMPYQQMTKAEEANAYNQSSSIFGRSPGYSSSYGSNSNASGPAGSEVVGGSAIDSSNSAYGKTWGTGSDIYKKTNTVY